MKTKNILGIIVMMTLFFTVPAFTKAQTISKNDVVTVAPQLVVVLNRLNSVIVVKENQYRAQDMALRNVASTLTAVVKTISELDTQNLSSADRNILNLNIDLLANSIGVLSAGVTNISNDRVAYNRALDNIVSVLGSITQILVTASK
jgi:hypothetical protein